MANDQLTLPLWSDEQEANPHLISPRAIWTRLSPDLLRELREDRRVEWKSARNIDFEDISEYYSAFSNTPDGGVLIFGVENDGTISGCSNLSQERLNNLETFSRKMCPLARPEFKRIPVLRGNFLIAVYLPYVGVLVETNKQEAYIRYGDHKSKMSTVEKEDFRSTRYELSFEMHSAALRFPEDFDSEIYQEFCTQFAAREGRSGWSVVEILEDRFLGKRTDSGFQPNNALVLLAARSPRSIIPGCRVRVQRFATPTEGSGSEYNPVRDRFVGGNIVSLIQSASAVIEEMTYDVTYLNKDGKFVTTPEYPRWAWFEALVNACVHRSYSFSGSDVTVKFFPDRLEIESPGGFVPPVNEANIYAVRAARNPHLMDSLRYLGYVRMAREGVRRIRDTMRAADLPEPVFQQESVHGVLVRVTLRNDYETRKRTTNREVAQYFGVDVWRQLQEHEITILAYAFRNGTINVSEAQLSTKRTWKTSKKDLEKLSQRGLLRFVPGSYPRDSKTHYEVVKNEPKIEDVR